MNIDVTISENKQEYFIGNIPMVEYCQIWSADMIKIFEFHNAVDGREWLDNSTKETQSEMDNCTKKLIREAESELKKAKLFLKENYPNEYRKEYKYILVRNPFKTLIAKWLLRSK